MGRMQLGKLEFLGAVEVTNAPAWDPNSRVGALLCREDVACLGLSKTSEFSKQTFPKGSETTHRRSQAVCQGKTLDGGLFLPVLPSWEDRGGALLPGGLGG